MTDKKTILRFARYYCAKNGIPVHYPPEEVYKEWEKSQEIRRFTL